MGLYTWPYRLDFELDNAGVARPDGPVPLRIDGQTLLRAVKASGHLDFRSLRVADMNLFRHEWRNDTVERETAVQFVPDAGFDPVRHPRGTLWFHLFKYPWEDKAFPRQFRLYFDTVNGGGKSPWDGTAEPKLEPVRLVEHVPGRLEFWCGNRLALAYQAPRDGMPGFHPVTSPCGKVLTADRPRDHLWHHGLCFGWTSVQCGAKKLTTYACWGEPGGGCRYPEDFTGKYGGPVLGGFAARSLYCTQQGEPVFTLDVAARYQPVDIGWHWLDIDLTLTAQDEPVEFKSDYGHIFARAALEFRTLSILDSTGQETRQAQQSTPALDWIGMGGEHGDGAASLLLLNDPANPGGKPTGDIFVSRRTEFMDRGALFATIDLNPFRAQPFLLAADSSATWRYRVVTTDRLLDAEFAGYQYAHWATPWVVRGLP